MWNCEACTFVNEPGATACSMCGTAAPGIAAAPAAVPTTSGESWECPSCTFVNTAGSTKCEMCGTARSGPPPDSSTPTASTAAAADPMAQPVLSFLESLEAQGRSPLEAKKSLAELAAPRVSTKDLSYSELAAQVCSLCAVT